MLALDEIVSEWLFVSGFWARINQTLGTMFDQFEEDEVAPDMLGDVASELDAQVRSLELSASARISFICRRLASGETLTVELQCTALLSELTKLRDFLIASCAADERVEFSL